MAAYRNVTGCVPRLGMCVPLGAAYCNALETPPMLMGLW